MILLRELAQSYCWIMPEVVYAYALLENAGEIRRNSSFIRCRKSLAEEFVLGSTQGVFCCEWQG